MFYPAKLIMKSYKPLSLERGMLFMTRVGDFKVWELEKVPESMMEYCIQNGYPREPEIIDPVTKEILAVAEQIALIDEEGMLREMTIDDLSYVMNDKFGDVEIDIEPDGEDVVPIIEDGAVILRI